MRILHLDSGRGMRGGQWQALRLHCGLLALGHTSFLLAREGSALLNEPASGVLEPLRIAALSRDFDLVHAHDARSHTLAALLAHPPLVVSRRVAFPVRTSLLSRWKYGRPALFLAVSKFVAAELSRAGVGESRIAVVYDGVPVPPEPACGDSILVFDKDTGLAAGAMRLSDEDAGRLFAVKLDRSRDLAADLPHARALLYLTNSEGLGSGILLAMAHGVAVIASRVGGIPELIRDGENGILVANELGSIAEGLRRIDNALGAAARKTVLERFTEEHMVQATMAAYRQVLAHA